MKTIIYPGQDDQRVADWVLSRIDWMESWGGKFKAIGLEQDGELIAGVVFNHYRQNHSMCMHVAAIPGKQWMTRQFLYEAFHYPFEVCNCIRLTTHVRESEIEVLKFDRHIGWMEEGYMRNGFSVDEGVFVMGMLKDECRFLTMKVS